MSGSSDDSKGVKFGPVSIREYELFLGDNPCCREGPSLSLGWSYNKSKPIDIDKYEEWAGGNRRTKVELQLPAEHRIALLKDFGYSGGEMRDSVAQNKECRRLRVETANGSVKDSLKESFIDMRRRRKQKNGGNISDDMSVGTI